MTSIRTVALLAAIAALLACSVGAAVVLRSRRIIRKQHRAATRFSCSYDTHVYLMENHSSSIWRPEAKLGTDDTKLPTRIIDINRFGASIKQIDPPLGVGPIQILVGTEWVRGQIRWSNQSCFGAKFDNTLTDAQVSLVFFTETRARALS